MSSTPALNDQPFKYRWFSDIPDKLPAAESDPKNPVLVAIRREWPKAHPQYHNQILKRFAQIPMNAALKAICAGYSSPSAAMAARVIKRKPVGLKS